MARTWRGGRWRSSRHYFFFRQQDLRQTAANHRQMTFLLRTSALTLHTSSISKILLSDKIFPKSMPNAPTTTTLPTRADADGDDDEVGPLPRYGLPNKDTYSHNRHPLLIVQPCYDLLCPARHYSYAAAISPVALSLKLKLKLPRRRHYRWWRRRRRRIPMTTIFKCVGTTVYE